MVQILGEMIRINLHRSFTEKTSAFLASKDDQGCIKALVSFLEGKDTDLKN